MEKLLSVNDLSVLIPSRFGDFLAVDSINLDVSKGQIHGLVGESGAGKSTIGAAIIGLLDTPAFVSGGTIHLAGQSLTELDAQALERLRGNRISMIFQDPQTSLNPLLSISDQLVETIRQHTDMSRVEALATAIGLLEETGIDNAAQRIDDYPHQFSGGMRQRVVIALALCTEPALIIADEPTTALDVSVQKQILKLIRDLAKQRGVGVILITHDIGVIAEITDVVTVLRYGRVVEHGTTAKVLGSPDETYTQQLMAAVPRLDTRLERFVNIAADDHRIDGNTQWQVEGASDTHASQWLLKASTSARPNANTAPAQNDSATSTDSMLHVQNLSVTYDAKRSWFGKKDGFRALDNISMNIKPGQVLGIVGESGSGKSTLAKAIVGLVPVSAGTMLFNNLPLPDARARARTHPARRQIQMVFQDPYSSLNNRRTVEQILTESLRFYRLADKGIESRRLVASMLELVEMPQRAMLKYPHQFSGGQRQRIAIARALMARPDFLICDEPTSALDVSIQAQILNLLKELQKNLGLTIVFISHNLAVVRQMADTVMVLRKGQHVESGMNDEFFSNPTADYSQQLLRESPSLDLLLTP